MGPACVVVAAAAASAAAVWRVMGPELHTVPIPQCGYLCHEDLPDVVNRELLAFRADWRG